MSIKKFIFEKKLKYTDRYVWLDLARGMAAITVCAGHLRSALLVDYSELTHSSYILKAFYFLTSLGHQAVIIFFVLSGFFVGGSILRNLENFSFKQYFAARLTRLWVVLIPALLLTAIVDETFSIYAPEILTGNLNSVVGSFPMVGAYSGSMGTFIGNLLFLQNIYTPVFGINGPLWSLANEFWYYVLFPLIILALGKFGNYKKVFLRLMGLVIFLAILFTLPRSFMEGFLIWLMGAGVFAATQTMLRVRRWMLLIGSLGLGSLSLLYTKLDHWQLIMGISQDLMLGIGFSSICLIAATWTKPSKSIVLEILNRISLAISEVSYSLYVSHFPFIALISSFAYKSEKLLPNITSIYLYLCWLIGLFGVWCIFCYTFERRTVYIKDFFIKTHIKN